MGLGKGSFCKFLNCIFYQVKIVKPNQSIESIIFERYPSLNSQNVRECDVKQLLDRFGHRCLIVFDGFDEFKGNNEDVMKIIQGRHLSHVFCFVNVPTTFSS